MLFSKKHDINLWLMMKADEENNKKILGELKNLPDYFYTEKQKDILNRQRWLNGEIPNYRCDYEKEHYNIYSPPNHPSSLVNYSISLISDDISLYVHKGERDKFRWLFALYINVDDKEDMKPLGSITINCGFFRDEVEEDYYHYYGDTINYYYKETEYGVYVISYIQKKKRIGFFGEQPKEEVRSMTFIEYKDIPFDTEITLETLQELCKLSNGKRSLSGVLAKILKK